MRHTLGLLRDPLGLIHRLFFKLVVGPRRYGRIDGYDAERYWGDRFRARGRALRAAGDEGLSEGENQREYARAAEVFLRACESAELHLPKARVLEIGSGTGFYTHVLREQGVQDYTAIDVTDALFEELREAYPGYRFVQQDATARRIEGTYDLIVMIDVVEHIVDEPRLEFLLSSVRDALAEDGVFIISGPLRERPSRRFFYLRFWRLEDIARHFPGYDAAPVVPNRNGVLLRFTKRSPRQTEAA